MPPPRFEEIVMPHLDAAFNYAKVADEERFRTPKTSSRTPAYARCGFLAASKNDDAKGVVDGNRAQVRGTAASRAGRRSANRPALSWTSTPGCRC